MELFLIRHGQSLNNFLPQEQRVEDPPLTDLGHQQAVLLAEWIESASLTRLICSPFRRALETAEYVRRTTGLRPEIWIDLHEQGGCVAGPTPDCMVGRPGMTLAQISADFPGFQIGDDIDGEGWWKSETYETLEQAQLRAAALVRRTRIVFQGAEERVAYVMHGTFKLLLIESFFADSDLETESLVEVNNAAVTRIVLTADAARLKFFNYISHLPVDLIS